MELVRFYACEGDPLRVALKLALKASEQGQRAQILGARAELEKLSAALWRCEGFVAHAGPAASAEVRARSSLCLSEALPAAAMPLLINLGQELPDELPVDRLFELVGPEPEVREAGRRRFRRHLQLGRKPESVSVRE